MRVHQLRQRSQCAEVQDELAMGMMAFLVLAKYVHYLTATLAAMLDLFLRTTLFAPMPLSADPRVSDYWRRKATQKLPSSPAATLQHYSRPLLSASAPQPAFLSSNNNAPRLENETPRSSLETPLTLTDGGNTPSLRFICLACQSRFPSFNFARFRLPPRSPSARHRSIPARHLRDQVHQHHGIELIFPAPLLLRLLHLATESFVQGPSHNHTIHPHSPSLAPAPPRRLGTDFLSSTFTAKQYLLIFYSNQH
ncbi:hypothetical protein A4X09_0g27 [Tilletia walkeri]|uniref:Uncharacterized protein n=1 Tax=Tilletia walkeri TaxID=117179 RepID=A0A8X7T8R9_9BASI|nr:hypothetical protein A4X09_0g27 [Tilletia walkeri]